MKPVNYDELTPRERKQVREAYIEFQKGKCSFCGKDLKQRPLEEIHSAPINKSLFPEKFFDYPIHLHHNHETGMTIGAVHAQCNAYLWQYRGE